MYQQVTLSLFALIIVELETSLHVYNYIFFYFSLTNIYLLCFFCTRPNIPPTNRHLRQFGLMTEDPTLWWKAGLGVAAATVLGFVVLKALHSAGTHVRY